MYNDRPTLEQLLADRESRIFGLDNNSVAKHPEDADILTAEGNATIEDLIEMIHMIVRKSMRDLGVEFIQEEGVLPLMHPEEPIEHPYITYKIIERRPDGEMRPRVRQYVKEKSHDEDEARNGEIRGQKFVSTIQFNIFASEYAHANHVMNRFEDMMMSYLYYFKKKGITNLFFKEQLTDDSLKTYRQVATVKSLRYTVYTEKLYILYRSNINDVEIMEDERR